MKNLNGNNIKRVLVISDLSCFGKCSLTASIPIISAYGVEVVPLPTALLSNHTGGFCDYYCLELNNAMQNITKQWQTLGLEFDCIYTGYFSDPQQIDITLEIIDRFKKDKTLLIVDPVMGDNGSLYKGLNEGFINGMQKLCEKADIITPNITEAALLTNRKVEDNPHDLLNVLRAKNVVITGVIDGNEIGCIGNINGAYISITKPYVDRQLHGCGDVFTSALCGELLCGVDMEKAVLNAAEFCDQCIRETDKDHPYHSYGLKFESVLKEKKQHGNS